MKYYEEVLELKPSKHFTHKICDMCHRLSTAEHTWGTGMYDVDNCKIECTVGQSYPESGEITHTSCDICSDCFLTHLVPWLESQGVSLNKEDRDY